MFPINFNFPYRKKDGSIITMEKALDGAGADLDLVDLDDVAITNPADDDGLVYDATAQKWENVPITTKEQWKKNGAYNHLENKGVSQALGGIVFSVSGGVITAVVPSEEHAANFDIVPSTNKITLPAGKYKLICLPSSAQDIYCQGFGNHDYTSGLGIIDTGDGVEFTLTQENDLYFFIHIGATANAGTYTFKPMITTDLNATYADYVPYAKTNRELTTDKYLDNSSYYTSLDTTITTTFTATANGLYLIAAKCNNATSSADVYLQNGSSPILTVLGADVMTSQLVYLKAGTTLYIRSDKGTYVVRGYYKV